MKRAGRIVALFPPPLRRGRVRVGAFDGRRWRESGERGMEKRLRVRDLETRCVNIAVRLRFSFSGAKTPGASAIFPGPAGKF
jgi:hypothetical protein